MKNKILILLALIIYAFTGNAQQVPYFNHVYLNQALINPSMNGMSENAEVMVIQRNNLIGFPESPQTTMLNIQSPLAEHSGLGFTIYRESLGITNKNAAYISYAYSINFQKNHRLNLGMSMGLFQFSINPDMTNIGNAQDPVLLNKSFRSSTLDGAVGATYINNNFQAGLSAMQIFSTKANLADEVNFQLEQNYVGMLQYTLPLDNSENFKITPIVIGRYGKSELPQDIILSMSYKDKFWLSPSYSSVGAVGVSAAAFLHNKFKIGYAYEAIVSQPVSGNQKGGHEIMLSYQFRNYSKMFDKQQDEIDQLFKAVNDLATTQKVRDSLQDARTNGIEDQIDELENQVDQVDAENDARYDSVQVVINKTKEQLDKLKKDLIEAGVIKEFSKDEYDNAEAGYYIVIASVKNTRYNPVAMKKEYLDKGFKVVYNKVRGWHYVYTVRLDNFSEALQQLKKTRATMEETAWIHVLK